MIIFVFLCTIIESPLPQTSVAFLFPSLTLIYSPPPSSGPLPPGPPADHEGGV